MFYLLIIHSSGNNKSPLERTTQSMARCHFHGHTRRHRCAGGLASNKNIVLDVVGCCEAMPKSEDSMARSTAL